MDFRVEQREREKYLGNPFLAALLHGAVALSAVGAAYFSLALGSWLPAIGWAVVVSGLEILFWYDTVIGWPRGKK